MHSEEQMNEAVFSLKKTFTKKFCNIFDVNFSGYIYIFNCSNYVKMYVYILCFYLKCYSARQGIYK